MRYREGKDDRAIRALCRHRVPVLTILCMTLNESADEQLLLTLWIGLYNSFANLIHAGVVNHAPIV